MIVLVIEKEVKAFVQIQFMSFKHQVLSRYKTVGLDTLTRYAKEFLDKFFPDFKGPLPKFQIVNHTASPWLGRCRFDRKNDKTSTIKIQKSITGDEESLRRILAHELVHHVDFLTNLPSLSTLDFKRYDGHGKWFKKQAERINSVMGEDYIAKGSDANIVVEYNQKEIYVLVMPSFSNKERLGFSYAVRPSAKQKEYLKRILETHEGAKLVKSKDGKWTDGSLIGGRTISVPRDPDMVEALKRLYDEGEKAHI